MAQQERSRAHVVDGRLRVERRGRQARLDELPGRRDDLHDPACIRRREHRVVEPALLPGDGLRERRRDAVLRGDLTDLGAGQAHRRRHRRVRHARLDLTGPRLARRGRDAQARAGDDEARRREPVRSGERPGGDAVRGRDTAQRLAGHHEVPAARGARRGGAGALPAGARAGRRDREPRARDDEARRRQAVRGRERRRS